MSAASPDTPLYNSRIFVCYLNLLKKRYANVSLAEILSYAGMKEFEVADPGHWFSQRQVDLFHEKAVQLTGNQGIAREAGRLVASPETLGFLRGFMLGLTSPEYLFILLNRVVANFSRSCRYATRKVGPRELEVTVTFEEGVAESPCQCENRIGCFEAIFELFGYDYPEIHHDECVFTGAEVCRYLVTWKSTSVPRLMLLRRLSIFLLLPLAAVTLGLTSSTPLGALFLGTVLLHLTLVLWLQWHERSSLIAAMGGLRASSEIHLGQIKGNYDSALMINEIGEVISSKTELDDIVASVNQVLRKRLDYSRGMILLADPAGNRLALRSCFGFTPEEQATVERLDFALDGPRGIFLSCFASQKPLLVHHLAEVAHLISSEHLPFFQSLGIRSFICSPIVCEGESLGILAVDDPRRTSQLLQSDLSLIQGVVPVIGIAIRNAMRLANERDLSEQLRRASEQLERRVQERTAELSRANELLEILYDSVSHDLRTPLRVIYGYGELLQDRCGNLLDATGKQYLDSMIKAGEQVEATLERMLDFSEIRLMELNPRQVDLSRMAHRILGDLQVTDPRREVLAKIEDGVIATGDQALLTSVMENLIGNAWKYTGLKASAEISFGVCDGTYFVSDNGEGFDMAFVDKLFAPFQRLHSSDKFPGHGLGLAMVQRMIERLGGRIWGIGKPGEGASFYFRLEGAKENKVSALPGS